MDWLLFLGPVYKKEEMKETRNSATTWQEESEGNLGDLENRGGGEARGWRGERRRGLKFNSWAKWGTSRRGGQSRILVRGRHD